MNKVVGVKEGKSCVAFTLKICLCEIDEKIFGFVGSEVKAYVNTTKL